MLISKGIDTETGYKLFLDSKLGYLIELPVCACCGGAEKLSDRVKLNGHYLCLDCKNKLNSYRVSKGRVRNAGPTARLSVAKNHLERVKYWLEVKETTGIGPKGLDEELSNLQHYICALEIAEREANEGPVVQPKHGKIHCVYCGKDYIGLASDRCPQCAARYKVYRSLMCKIGRGTATLSECDKLSKVLDEYVVLMRLGKETPDISDARFKLRVHINKLKTQVN